MNDTRALRSLALSAAREAGELLLHGRPARLTYDTKSTATDVVTEMDRRSERLLVERLLGERPDDSVIGEEGADSKGNSGITWVLDPIDGTVSYLYGQPMWAVSVAAEDAHGGLVGVVHVPAIGETYVGVRGEGAVRIDAHGEHRLYRDDEVRLGLALVGTGFGYDELRRRSQAQTLVEVLPAIRDIRRPGAASIDICWVADGRLDAYYERGLSHWDYAAAAVVAREAGVRIAGINGAAPGPEFLMAAIESVAAPLHDLLAAAGADRD